MEVPAAVPTMGALAGLVALDVDVPDAAPTLERAPLITPATVAAPAAAPTALTAFVAVR
jgi:hypothetical protein